MSSGLTNRREILRRDFLIHSLCGVVVATPWFAGCGPTEPVAPVALPENLGQPSKKARVSKDLRLTLSVLLAFREDILEPAEMADIARKLGDSASAQAVNQRIDAVTKARLDHRAIAEGDQMPESNQVAEYLEGGMSSAKLKEFELLCLQSDAVLAEVATCHQVLASFLRMEGKPDAAQHVELRGVLKSVLKQKIEAKNQSVPRDKSSK